MLTFPVLPGVEINVFLLAFIGFTVGVVGGFIGVGGGYMVTPALVVLGLPGNLAVGTSITHITGTSVVATLRHRSLGNVDVKLGTLLIVGMVGGLELGVRLLNWCQALGVSSEVVLGASLALLTPVGVYTAVEARSAKRKLDEAVARDSAVPHDLTMSSICKRVQAIRIPPMVDLPACRLRLSACLVVLLGFCTGLLSGFMGVGGAFILTPALIYLFGVPSLVAVGTVLFQIAFSGAYGCIRHGMSGNILIFAAVIMLLGASVGAQIGSLGTRYVRGPSIRGVLGLSVVVAAVGVLFKLVHALTGQELAWLQWGAEVCTFGGMGLLVVMILGLLAMALMYRRGMRVPKQFESLLVRGD
jgi:hypothetical protein